MSIFRTITLPVITSDGVGASSFSEREIDLKGDDSRCLSEQVPALNFRLRTSPADYRSDFHVAGDPTMLVILAGTIVIELKSGQRRTFRKGDIFIAEDYLKPSVEFDSELHGHKAEVSGDEPLMVMHLKLSKR